MARFGGDSKFGGDCEFGGADPRFVRYFRALKALDPPGVWNEEEDSIHYDLLKSYARSLGSQGQYLVDRLYREIFPHTAEENLAEWEKLYDVNKLSTDTITDRQARLIARWREANLSNLPDLRGILANYLNPTTAFWDRCDDSDVSFRWIEESGNGSISESTVLSLDSPASTNCKWTTTEKNFPRLSTRTHSLTDDVIIQAEVYSRSINNGTGGGIMLYSSESSAVCLEIHRDAGTEYVRYFTVLDGSRTNGTNLATSPLAVNYILRVKKDIVNGKFYFSYGTDENNLTTSGTTLNIADYPMSLSHAGVFGYNDTTSQCVVNFVDIKFWHGQASNNIEIIETPRSIAATGDDEQIFFAFVHREPTDSGAYSIAEAQAAMNRAKQAHTVIAVGESDCFRCDDPYSLTDRDILGS